MHAQYQSAGWHCHFYMSLSALTGHHCTAQRCTSSCKHCLLLQVKVQQLSDDIQYQVLARGSNADVSQDAAVLKDYFNLQASLSSLCQEWSNRDERFRKIHTYFPGSC